MAAIWRTSVKSARAFLCHEFSCHIKLTRLFPCSIPITSPSNHGTEGNWRQVMAIMGVGQISLRMTPPVTSVGEVLFLSVGQLMLSTAPPITSAGENPLGAHHYIYSCSPASHPFALHNQPVSHTREIYPSFFLSFFSTLFLSSLPLPFPPPSCLCFFGALFFPFLFFPFPLSSLSSIPSSFFVVFLLFSSLRRFSFLFSSFSALLLLSSPLR